MLLLLYDEDNFDENFNETLTDTQILTLENIVLQYNHVRHASNALILIVSRI